MVGTRRTGRMACLISGEAPSAPKAGCLVCGKAQLHLTVNTHTMTLHLLLDKVRWEGAMSDGLRLHPHVFWLHTNGHLCAAAP